MHRIDGAADLDGQFLTGSKIPLRVWNAPGAKEVKWTFDGSSIGLAKDGWYEVKRAGILSAEVIWEDGSSDIVVKKIIIK